MITRCCFVLAAVIPVLFGQNFAYKLRRKTNHSYQAAHPAAIPQYCWHPPRDIDLDRCCPTPSFYSDEVLESCGFGKPPINSAGFKVKPRGPKTVLPFCRDGLCLMKSAGLLTVNTSVDYVKLDAYIDQWAAENPKFTKRILEAKPVCAVEEYGKKPPKICDQDRIYICLNSYLLWNCKIKPFDECRRLKVYMDACRRFYEKAK